MNATTLGWLCRLGILAHSAEEALYLPGWSRSVSRWHVAVGACELRLAAGMQSLALLGIAGGASTTRAPGPIQYLWVGYALAMAINAIVPHLIGRFATRSSMPGTAPALCLNLPLGCLFIARSLSEQRLQLRVFLWLAPMTALFLLASIPVLFAVGRTSCQSKPSHVK